MKKAWLLVVPLVASLLWVSAAPTQAAGESWFVKSVNSPSCGSGAYNLQMGASGITGTVTGHQVITAGGLTYTNDEVPGFGNSEDFGWNFVDSKDYGPVANPGTYPIPAGQQVTATFMLESPKGNVLASWTMVIPSCDSSTLLYNGETSRDLDSDFVATPTDLCPSLKAFTANGCPERARALALKARYGPKRVVGKLYAAGYPDLYAGRAVQVWKKKPGPDRLVATRTTNSLGKFKAKVGKGRYYATSPTFIAPASGEALADTSNRVRVR